MLETAEHRQLLEKWMYEDLSEEEEKHLPAKLKERVKTGFRKLVDLAVDDVTSGRMTDGASPMQRLKQQISARRD